tara:strand:- start:5088 stop:5414 length:327 start_codon:yes stop_codon:yes gene_type:complete
MSYFLQSSKFPDELKLTIFNEHFKYKLKYNDLTQILNSELSQKLNISLLLPYVQENILNDKEYISFLLKINNVFKNIYTQHYINHQKNFILMNVNESFALSWLMYLYH